MLLQDFYGGNAFDAYTYFGAHLQAGGVMFRTYAPAAHTVEVLGAFSAWQPLAMQRLAQSGVFELFVPKAKQGDLYKYCVQTQNGARQEHCDPYGFAMELRPAFASVVTALDSGSFDDAAWMQSRTKGYDTPLNIYEVHLGSWKKPGDAETDWYRYDELAAPLIAYAKENGYTHIECMPLAEHPVDASWGYQTTGFFAPTARYGTPAQLRYFVNECHRAGIGVILDFVPVHFALDAYGLRRFDGTALYEYPPSDVDESEWGTCNFIYARGEVASFVQSCAHYWLQEFHFDGLRMDAVSRAIYWLGEPARGVNQPAVEFLRRMNSGLAQLHPTALRIAEDSTAYPKVTAPVEYGGLGFDYKWDLGFMHDTLNYFRTPPAERPAQYGKLLFSMEYFYNELYILEFSHDEVVHGKATIVQKMWGDYAGKFPQARAMYLYFYAHPGKKLHFMGNELGQLREWDEKRAQDWELLTYPIHDAFHHYMAALAKTYAAHPALHCEEYAPEALAWLERNAPQQSLLAFTRCAGGERVAAVCNFSDAPQAFALTLPAACTGVQTLLHSDWQCFGGSVPQTQPCAVLAAPQLLQGSLAPFSAVLLQLNETEKEGCK